MTKKSISVSESIKMRSKAIYLFNAIRDLLSISFFMYCSISISLFTWSRACLLSFSEQWQVSRRYSHERVPGLRSLCAFYAELHRISSCNSEPPPYVPSFLPACLPRRITLFIAPCGKCQQATSLLCCTHVASTPTDPLWPTESTRQWQRQRLREPIAYIALPLIPVHTKLLTLLLQLIWAVQKLFYRK